MGADHPADDGKAKSGAARLMGDERFKQGVKIFRRDAAAIIRHGKDKLTSGCLRLSRKRKNRSRNRTIGQRIPGISKEIEKSLPELHLVDGKDRQIRIDPGDKFNGVSIREAAKDSARVRSQDVMPVAVRFSRSPLL